LHSYLAALRIGFRHGHGVSTIIVVTRCFATTALCIGMTAARAGPSERALIANACWEYKHFSERDMRSVSICFQPGGLAAGESFHGTDAWGWNSRYKIADHQIFLHGEVWGHILGVDWHRMIIGGQDDEPRTYRFVCRTTAESIQCERLRRHIDRRWIER
jgi:hypothetical protein